ncbi:helix-turn-helix domain-containing protein [Eggerthella sp. YY7918]|uniref:helix-turn-helix domain-containing protein n=1 Tax=Eggerthella sp. (strain YY7918) TaxID=502558 RepID=UPI00021713D9|nr:helix-turn-helix transcriptional regulator [Eggerthella sp. YY7918]BAK44285.1 hypothetical protein EGYY_11100 [Eggerthella sp. YY7918]
MHDFNMGTIIARERRAAGITQDELAAHLGVTKAAVSKWELGQSLPDVALLPRIAAYFRLTLDELFDYRPQMSKDEVKQAYYELFAAFDSDADAAFARLESLAADYYSCWPLLQQMGMLCVQRSALDPERAPVLLAKGEELFDRVEAHADDVELVRSARMMKSTLLMARGDLDGAIELMESLKPDKPVGIESYLATMYQMKGEVDRCLKLHQEAMVLGVINAMASVSMQLPFYVDDVLHREALLRAGDALVVGFSLEEENPMAALSFWAAAATSCIEAGEDERAAAYLGRYVERLESLDVESLLSHTSLLYDRVPEFTGGDMADEPMARAQLESVDLREQYRVAVLEPQPWVERADDPRFKPLLDRVRAL